ncbi:Cro/CI family transcriptional regulator [Marinobacterium lutimaris]|uniref:DNA-binding transcriptional regulator Cro n=1 Tax=Marinobacterium lutimaris TaxID=568106 RepID=A0A1H5YB30_9GAMM|nr:Cro/CI family transcriptional regulator [Marinobacterium lutimaris]SEG21243.1 DNA-binding transcriptional regulator Cro [Marinobacterium lutimaris]
MTRSEAIEHFGGISELAKALGITYEAVRQWPEEIPLLRQYQLKEIIDAEPKVTSQNGSKGNAA